MSKALKIAAVVVAVAAITVATAGIGTAPAVAASSATVSVAGAGLAAGATATFAAAGVAATSASIFGLSVATLGAISTGLSLASSLTAKNPTPGSVQGSPTQWKADPNSPIPYAIGRTLVAGNIAHQAAYGGSDNPYQSFVTVYSAGPAQSIDAILVDKVATTFTGGAADGTYAGSMWLQTQLGAQPEASALAGPFGDFPGWSASSKLSGLTGSIYTLKFDKQGKIFPAGVPKLALVGHWAKAYDPRLDSTYPGGSGAHRANDEATWAWTENPWLHAITWNLGRFQNGKRILGVGLAPSEMVLSTYVEAANVADANGWTCGGVVSSGDSKWNVLKQMCQAGGGEPIQQGAMVAAYVNTPRVALATITVDDLAPGPVSVTAVQAGRDRINGIIPTYRSEAQDWENVPAAVVRNATYLAEDGRPKTKEVAYPLVQNLNQVAQLAAYDVATSREFGPIVLHLKIRWIAYKPGDAVAINLPDSNLNNQLAVILKRALDPMTGTVTLTLRSETTGKHAYCLGKTGTSPPTPALSARAWGAIPNPLATRNVDRGAWLSVGVAYTIGDEVQDQGSTWGALTDHVSTGANGPPALPTTSNTNWRLRAKAGDTGGDGRSAYAIAVAAGFGGSEAAWLASLHGTNGTPGAPGADGQTSYFHTKWSNDGGATFTSSGGEDVGSWLGTRTDFTLADSTNPGDYTWALVKGAPGAGTFNLIAGGNVSTTPNSVTKVSGGAAWSAGARSQEAYAGDVSTSARMPVVAGNHFMVALNSDAPTDGDDYGTLDFAVYGAAGVFTVYESGSFVDTYGPGLADGCRPYVRRRGTTIEYGIVGEIAPRHIRTGVSATTPLYFDCSIYSVGCTLAEIIFGPVGADGEDGADGLSAYQIAVAAGFGGSQAAWLASLHGTNGTPGAPGADGQTTYFHTKWSNDGGATFTSSGGEDVGSYLGTRTDFTLADSTNPGDYTWALVKGAAGDPGAAGQSAYQIAVAAGFSGSQAAWLASLHGTEGTPGSPGAPGQTTYFHTKWSNDGGATFTSSGGEDVGSYLGTRTDFTLADSTNPADYIWALVKGADGVSPAGGVVDYAYGDEATVILAAGTTMTFGAKVRYGVPTGGGNVQVQLQWSLQGSGTWTAFGTGGSATYGPGEPAASTIGTASYTNSSGESRSYLVRAIDSNDGGTGPVDAARSYMKRTA